MVKKELQTERMKSYFIQATKDILKAEGLRGFSVRNIAERAGYSYATLYNYFDDASDLIFECVQDFLEECEAFIATETTSELRGRSQIKSIVQAYTKYFVQYGGIFELLYLEKPSNLSQRSQTIELITTFLDRICEKEWSYAIAHEGLSRQEAQMQEDQLRYTTLGMLLLYLTRKEPGNYEEFVQRRDEQLDYILDL